MRQFERNAVHSRHFQCPGVHLVDLIAISAPGKFLLGGAILERELSARTWNGWSAQDWRAAARDCPHRQAGQSARRALQGSRACRCVSVSLSSVATLAGAQLVRPACRTSGAGQASRWRQPAGRSGGNRSEGPKPISTMPSRNCPSSNSRAHSLHHRPLRATEARNTGSGAYSNTARLSGRSAIAASISGLKMFDGLMTTASPRTERALQHRQRCIQHGGDRAPVGPAPAPADQVVAQHRFGQAHRQPLHIEPADQHGRCTEGGVEHEMHRRARRPCRQRLCTGTGTVRVASPRYSSVRNVALRCAARVTWRNWKASVAAS